MPSAFYIPPTPVQLSPSAQQTGSINVSGNITSGTQFYIGGTALKDVTETLTNKTLTSPTITSPTVSSGTTTLTAGSLVIKNGATLTQPVGNMFGVNVGTDQNFWLRSDGSVLNINATNDAYNANVALHISASTTTFDSGGVKVTPGNIGVGGDPDSGIGVYTQSTGTVYEGFKAGSTNAAANIYNEVSDATASWTFGMDGSVSHEFYFYNSGKKLSIFTDGGITVGSPTGGSKGADTVNAANGYYVNGERIGVIRASFVCSTDLFSNISLSTGWNSIDTHADCSFTVGKSDSTIIVIFEGGPQIGVAVGGDWITPGYVFDSSGTVGSPTICGTPFNGNNTPFIVPFTSTIVTDGLAAGTHVVSPRIKWGSASSSADGMYWRPSSIPDIEYFKVTVIEILS